MIKKILLLLFLTTFSSTGLVLDTVQFHGMVNLRTEALAPILALNMNKELDSSSAFAYAHSALMRTALFDTVVFRPVSNGKGLTTLHVFVQERKRSSIGFQGAAAGLSLFGKGQIWASVSPGVEVRDLFGRPQTLTSYLSFPFFYGALVHWRDYGFPSRTLTTGVVLSAQSYPFTNSSYYQREATGSLYLQHFITPALSARVSGGYELSRTWRINTSLWKDDRWSIIRFDPDAVSEKMDPRYTAVYPKTEEAPFFALSTNFDKRDNPLYPSRGYQIFLEGKHYNVTQTNTDYHFSFNQATAIFKGYKSFTEKQIGALQLKTIVRDNFDPEALSHRLTFHNETNHFFGFRSIAGTNLAFANIEYRIKLFEVDMEALMPELSLTPFMMKHIRRLSYRGDAFLFADNGFYFGRILTNVRKDVPFKDLSSDDLFTSVGLGGRLIYPRLGYVVTGGLTLWQHYKGLPDEYLTRVFATASLNF